MKFEYNVYLDLYRVHKFFFVKSPYNLYILSLSVKDFRKSLHEIVTSGIISVHQDTIIRMNIQLNTRILL